MSFKLNWDGVGERFYETGVDRGVLYIPNASGVYDNGVAWNGLTTVTETPSGASANPVYADNMKWLNLISVEQFDGQIDAFMFPDEWTQFDGGVRVGGGGVIVGQQKRGVFGLCYRTRLGNDQDSELGYKLHLVYGAQAQPSQRAYATVNDTPAPTALSWQFTTTPVPVTGLRPTSLITIESPNVNASDLAALEQILYGTDTVDPRLPLPDEVIALFGGTVQSVIALSPTFSANTISIPTVTGVTYTIAGETVSGSVAVTTGDTVLVKAYPTAGYVLAANSDDDWEFVGV